MADANGALAQEAANLHLDEVTGEKVSKSELKKRQKGREQEKKKAEKAAAAPPKTEKKKAASAEANEAELNPNVRIFASIIICIANRPSNTLKFGVGL